MAIAVAAGLVLWAGSGFAQETAAPERIVDVQIRGLVRVRRDTVLQAIRLRANDLYTARAVDEDIRRLDALGCFVPTGINVRREPAEGGVVLIFDLKERPVITALRFTGNRAIPESKLREAVGLKEGAFLDVAGGRESARRIQDLYREQRFQFVEVEREDKLDEARNAVEVVFVVKEGPQVALKGIRFDGNRAFDAKRLLDQMETKAAGLTGREPFNDVRFKEDLVRLRQYYRRQGYLDAVVTGDYEYSPDKTELTVVVRITEGEVYRVGSVSVSGVEIVPPEELTKDFRLRPGAVFSGDDSEHDLQVIVRFYSARGYVDVHVEPKETFPEPGVVDLVFVVTESRPMKIGLIDIRGNTKTKDKVIRREFDIYPGDLFDAAKIEKGIERLRAIGYFTRVDTTLTRGDLPEERSLVVEVEEGRSGRIMFGAAVSSDTGVTGLFQLSLENFDITDWPSSFGDLANGNAFVGGGQRLLVQLAPGSELNQARIYFFDPHIFDSRYWFSSDLYIWERERESYTEGRTGVRLAVGRKLTERLSGRLTFRLENIDISELDDDAPPDVLAVAGKSSIASVILGLDYDRTDDRLAPAGGYRLEGSLEVAGGDASFVKAQAGGTLYRTIRTTADGRKHVLALTGQVGAISSGDPVPVFERFYAGGRGSLRGFAYRGASPRQIDTPVGGEFLALGSVEYFFPVYQSTYRGKPYEMVRGVVFVDFGKVAYSLDDIGADKFRAAAGVGVRLSIPALGRVPIALDLGFPISKDDGDETQLFSFSLGAEF